MSPWLTITSVGQAEHDATDIYRQGTDYTVSLRDTGDVLITINDDRRWNYEPIVAQHWKPTKVQAQLRIPPPPAPVRLR
jgi:hypothetical protein